VGAGSVVVPGDAVSFTAAATAGSIPFVTGAADAIAVGVDNTGGIVATSAGFR